MGICSSRNNLKKNKIVKINIPDEKKDNKLNNNKQLSKDLSRNKSTTLIWGRNYKSFI